MGQDYSYSQPSSSSNSLVMSSLLEAEAKLYADEAESPYCNAEPDQFPPQREADDGIPMAYQKLLKLQKTVCELKKKSETTNAFALALCVMVSALVFIGLAAMFLSGRASKK
ncbi:hypothetical protein F2Q70_00043142 [Brassica cretica]|uniref:Uncharacterized protein n=1 Tax=Brassica cretica TaxID=69181 RepID=A0A8S9KLN7_BRACR|nr:hypothetical protein F2Q70_00043142 [Brassica cretica]